MACFIAPLIAAALVTTVQRLAKGVGERLRLSVLGAILWGGSLLLAVEHAWHGEVVLYPPFLTAMASPSNVAAVVHEVATVGVAMVLASAALWGGFLGFDRLLASRRLLLLKTTRAG